LGPEGTPVSPFAEEYVTEEEVSGITTHPTSWLSYSHINAASTIARFLSDGKIGGFYKVQLMHKGFPRFELPKWMQLLLLNSGQAAHWVLAAKGFNNNNGVTVYDPKIPDWRDDGIHPET